MKYVGIDWAYGRAAWCAIGEAGAIEGEGLIPADEDGLAKLVLHLGSEVHACVEMMSGAIWVRDRLELAGWEVEIAHARKVRDIAPLPARPTRSMPGSWPSFAAATWCRRSGCLHSRIARSASAFAAAPTWSSSAPRIATGSSACSLSSDSGSLCGGFASPTRSGSWSAAACPSLAGPDRGAPRPDRPP
jgi:hypothetical protein